MDDTQRRPRIFVLGAGFSAPAGLPISRELLDLVLSELGAARNDSHLREALEDYLDYVKATLGRRPIEIDIEDFAAYLDYEHFFGMLGSDTWSTDGNRPQFQLRWGIGRVLHRRTPSAQDLPSCYLRFAERMHAGDAVVTFNYDRVLELAMERVGVPYRRFPNRYQEVRPYASVVDSDAQAREVLIVKVHGSIDWVSAGSFREQQAWYREIGDELTADFSQRRDPLFGTNPVSPTRPLIEGPSPKSDPLNSVEVLEDLDSYYGNPHVLYYHPPLLLAPSTAKQLYGRSLADFWTGIGNFAWGWSGLTVIGYSLPPADPYSRQVLYRIVQGYRTGLVDPRWRLGPMRPMEVVSLKLTDKAIRDLRRTYRFMDPKRTRFLTGGFDDHAVDELFRQA